MKKTIALGAVLLLGASTSFANDIEQLEIEREKAQNDYIQSVIRERSTTKEGQALLREKYLTPAEQNIKGQAERFSQTKPRVTLLTQAQLKAPGSLKNIQPTIQSSGGSVPSPSGNGDSRGGSANPEYTLDGSKIPKELDFSSPSSNTKPASLSNFTPARTPASQPAQPLGPTKKVLTKEEADLLQLDRFMK